MGPDFERKCLIPRTMSQPADDEVALLRRKLFAPEPRLSAQTFRIDRQHNVYTCGDEDRMIYCILRGHIKLVIDSREGKECLLDIYSSGDFFGESCLAGLSFRVETATAMEDAVLKRINCQRFVASLSEAELHGFIRQLNKRMVEQQLFITDMVTMGSEYRLGKVLLRLSARLGKEHPLGTILDCRISQEELSHMVGTTRPRVNEFINKFRKLGLIHSSAGKLIIIREADLAGYLSSIS